MNIPYVTRRSARARRISIHVGVNGMVELVLPRRSSLEEGKRFLRQKSEWLRQQLAVQTLRRQQIPKRVYATGEVIPCFGKQFILRVEAGKRQSAVAKDNILVVSLAHGGNPRVVIEKWLRVQAKHFFDQETLVLAKQASLPQVRVRITGARSRWGSCNIADKRLSFTWRLALAPVEAARYVAAHEVAHLRYPGHPRAFWNFVADLFPHYMHWRLYLRRYGHTLEL